MDLAGVNDRIPVNHPLDGPTGAFYVKGLVTGYGGLKSSLKVLKVLAWHARRSWLEGGCVKPCFSVKSLTE